MLKVELFYLLPILFCIKEKTVGFLKNKRTKKHLGRKSVLYPGKFQTVFRKKLHHFMNSHKVLFMSENSLFFSCDRFLWHWCLKLKVCSLCTFGNILTAVSLFKYNLSYQLFLKNEEKQIFIISVQNENCNWKLWNYQLFLQVAPWSLCYKTHYRCNLLPIDCEITFRCCKIKFTGKTV